MLGLQFSRARMYDAVAGRWYSEDPSGFADGTDLVSGIERLAHVEELLPDICTLDCGSLNFGEGSLVYVSTPDLASYIMGPWWMTSAHTQPFVNLPKDQHSIFRVALNTTYPSTTHSSTQNGAVGIPFIAWRER